MIRQGDRKCVLSLFVEWKIVSNIAIVFLDIKKSDSVAARCQVK